MDRKDNKSFKCDYCGKYFARVSYRTKHIKRLHNKTSQDEDIFEKQSFFCELCKKWFSYRSSLQRHINTFHLPNERLSCDACVYTTVRKDDLMKHINTVHLSHSKPKRAKYFKCAHCPSAFTEKNNLRRHKKTKHSIKEFSTPKTNRKCPLCNFSSSGPRKKEINDHFKNDHNLNMEWLNFDFQNMSEFDDWKNKIELQDNVSFVKGKFCTNRSFHYLCFRSGKFIPVGTNKRRLKMGGSCKINAHCPSEIVVKTHVDGRIHVRYLPTHIGHKNELTYTLVRAKERRLLATKLLSKLPHYEICTHLIREYDNTVIDSNSDGEMDFSTENQTTLVQTKNDSGNEMEKKKEKYTDILLRRRSRRISAAKPLSKSPHYEILIPSIPQYDNAAFDSDSDGEMDFSTENQITLAQTKNDSGDEMEEKKGKIIEIFKMIMEEALTEEQINFVSMKIKSIYEVVKLLPTTST